MPSFKSSSYKDIDKFNAYRKKDRDKKVKKSKDYIESNKKPCLFCNSTENIEFHHFNPLEKEVNSIARLYNYSNNRIDEELKKCWCLCYDCHKKLHRRLCDPLPICYEDT
jgi:hypothetical protein